MLMFLNDASSEKQATNLCAYVPRYTRVQTEKDKNIYILAFYENVNPKKSKNMCLFLEHKHLPLRLMLAEDCNLCSN